MLKNFFRKDLNLGKKWWHRALLSIYFISLALTLVFISIFSFSDDEQYAKVGPISDYFTFSNIRLQDIVESKSGYKVGEINYFSKYYNSEYNTYKENTFCGKNITQSLDGYTIGDKLVKRFMLKDENGIRQDVSKEELATSLKASKTNCITIDSYSADMFGNKNYFIEPYEYSKVMWFYEYSFFMTLLNCLLYIGYAVLVFIGILIFYYKVIIYIVYGK